MQAEKLFDDSGMSESTGSAPVSGVKAEVEAWVTMSDFATTQKLIYKPEDVCNT